MKYRNQFLFSHKRGMYGAEKSAPYLLYKEVIAIVS